MDANIGNGSARLLLGDCLERLRELPDNSIDSVVTDPPYGLEFMGKDWDGADGFRRSLNKADAGRESVFGRTSRTSPEYRAGHVMQEWCEAWARECLRVLKPGGHLLAFSGSRTYHRMACAIEDAGFEIRDQIMYVYGSGFPKSMNLDRERGKKFCGCDGGADRGGASHRPRSAAQRKDESGTVAGQSQPQTLGAWPVCGRCGLPRVPSGLGTALKPAHEPICMARKPLAKGNTVAENVLAHGTGVINVDGCRVPFAGDDDEQESKGKNQHKTFGSAPPLSDVYQYGLGSRDNYNPPGRWTANLIHDGSDEVLAHFPNSNGAGGSIPNVKITGYGDGIGTGKSEYLGGERTKVDSGSGSAARFFYCAKASRRDRNEGLFSGDEKAVGTNATMREKEDADWSKRNGNHHPTVKPTDLMRYLCRLVTQPGGVILDLFTGSGSTGKAAMLEGFRFIGCELSPEYLEIARARIEHAYGVVNPEEVPDDVEPEVQMSLFG